MAKNKSVAMDINGNPFSRSAMVAVLLIGTFAGVLMQTSLGTAIPTLMRDFDITLATAQQATTWFLLANGIMMPVSAYLSTRIPSKVLYIFAYLMLFAGMATTAFTPAHHDMWWMFLLGRILVAIAVGVTMPLMQVVMVNIFPAEERGAAMGINGIVIGLAPAIGPTLSGWILEKNHHFLGLTISDSWRTIFYLPMFVLALVIIASPFFIKNVIPNRKMKLDVPSLIISTLGFGIFLWSFTNVATDGWGDFKNVILPMIVGLLFIVLFVVRQLKLDEPFVDVKVFKNHQFALTTVSVMMAMRLALTGFSILAIGTVPFLFLTASTPAHFITALYAVRMFGIAMAMMPLTAMAMSVLPPAEAPHATAANNTARQVASAVVVALLSSVTQNVISNNEPAKALSKTNPLQYGADYLDASMKGFHVSFAIGLGFAIVGIVVAMFLKGGAIKAAGYSNHKPVDPQMKEAE